MSTGWECPRCHRTYAPEVQQCVKCPFEHSQLYELIRKDKFTMWDGGGLYRVRGLSGGDEGPRTWTIAEAGEGKGIINSDGKVFLNVDQLCYCHPCVKRRRPE